MTAVEHLRAAGHDRDAVAAYLREAAFTTLNRFVALKMLEARGLVQECLSGGEESSGFKEFIGLAPGLVQLPDHGFRLYIESLFDESFLGHGYALNDAQTRIPLVVANLPVTIEEPFGQIDLRALFRRTLALPATGDSPRVVSPAQHR